MIAFPGNRFKGEIVPAMAELVSNGVVHILDVVFIKKDADGLVTSFEYDGLDEGLEPDSSAALIVWEHRWAARVAQAIRDAGGRIVGGERVPHEIVQGALADGQPVE